MTDWENVPPDEWPFVYLIQQPGTYLDGDVETYRELYGTCYSTEPIEFSVGDTHDHGEGEHPGASARSSLRRRRSTRRSSVSSGPDRRRA